MRREIDPSELPSAGMPDVFDRIEREHPDASDAEKYRLLQAALLLYLRGYRPLPDSAGWALR